MSRPTLFLSNWSSHRTPGMHGPGRKWTAMAEPRAWEWGAGRIRALTPELGDPDGLLHKALAERRSAVDGELTAGPAMLEYRLHFIGGLIPLDLAPGGMVATAGGGTFPLVADGDTVCCACSVKERRAGRCHLAWAAPFLAVAGWRVVLDGVEVRIPHHVDEFGGIHCACRTVHGETDVCPTCGCAVVLADEDAWMRRPDPPERDREQDVADDNADAWSEPQ